MAEFNLWLLILGIAAGAAVTWLVIGTIARNDDEIASSEAAAEADWIARTIEDHGGRAPIQLVEQILALHRRYLRGGSVAPAPAPEDAAEAAVTDSSEPDIAVEDATPDETETADAEAPPASSRRQPKSERGGAGPRKRATRRTVRP